MSKYTTGEMAKMCNVSVRTVQFYDTKGILHPSELTEGGRRLYTDDDLVQMRLICMLRTLGLTLDSIQGILKSEKPAKVLNLLLDEHTKQLDGEIKEKQEQVEAIKLIKESIGDREAIPVNSISDIGVIMENNKKVRKKFRKLVVTACFLSIPQFAFIALWIVKGMWIPFVVWFPIQTLLGILLAKHYFKDAAFICPECNAVFKPPFSKLMRTSGTTKARWLTCTECGHKGYCVETIAKEET
ncbi:MAG: MerR family transcriptional regulator [Oscillospiraceae bacterium]|nr:MerR family transcriptional regulator [Oscillospiraceae bacterium]